MTVHLKKLSVGSASLASLQEWQAARLAAGMDLIHLTRNTPRRWQEVLDGGSIFWVIKGVMCARQPITELRAAWRVTVSREGPRGAETAPLSTILDCRFLRLRRRRATPNTVHR